MPAARHPAAARATVLQRNRLSKSLMSIPGNEDFIVFVTCCCPSVPPTNRPNTHLVTVIGGTSATLTSASTKRRMISPDNIILRGPLGSLWMGSHRGFIITTKLGFPLLRTESSTVSAVAVVRWTAAAMERFEFAAGAGTHFTRGVSASSASRAIEHPEVTGSRPITCRLIANIRSRKVFSQSCSPLISWSARPARPTRRRSWW
ncbi:Uncharacterised protein [Mycobacteroides abscessus subsp. abscessus]|nr:Uncharacterised protein [Mycobacteroides abscessus subsp. abscessus]